MNSQYISNKYFKIVNNTHRSGQQYTLRFSFPSSPQACCSLFTRSHRIFCINQSSYSLILLFLTSSLLLSAIACSRIGCMADSFSFQDWKPPGVRRTFAAGVLIGWCTALATAWMLGNNVRSKLIKGNRTPAWFVHWCCPRMISCLLLPGMKSSGPF